MFLRSLCSGFALFFILNSLSGCAVLIPFVAESQIDQLAVLGPPCYREMPKISASRDFDLDFANNDPSMRSAGYDNNYVITPRRAKSDSLYRQLLQQLKHSDPAKRTCAATDLAALSRNKNDIIPYLADVLKHDANKWVRRAAAKSLGKIGTNTVIAPLTAALGDSDKWVAHSAANALEKVRARLSVAQIRSSEQIAAL